MADAEVPLRLHTYRNRMLLWDPEAVRIVRERYRMWGVLVGAPWRRGGGRRLPLQLLPEEGRLLQEMGAAMLDPEPEMGRPERRPRQEVRGGRERPEVGLERPRPEVGLKMPETEVGMKRPRPEVGVNRPETEVRVKRPRPEVGVESCGEEVGEKRPEIDGPEVGREGPKAEKPEAEMKGPETEVQEVGTDGPEVGTDGPEVDVEGPEMDAERPEADVERPEAEGHVERRFRVYRDLWGRGFHLTAGGKFGGDFLVYPGPPPLFHAGAVAHCPCSSAPLPLGALLSAARLGTAARKSLLLCAAPPGGATEYSQLRWRRDLA
ncbi:tRNA-splicing endonuclease subunit Sen34 isoform X2 [Coturnix japonica]|uniref:tRNA-splicing endonuclease subunit Sen34 isoform X2 n=1 Tax=Coturnix japonica TaxID=93934 RepID=UPI0007776E0F|nr:tRNA-splicing endonuclease subunit Sen34 isoform X2 [Coturnix japonica]